MQDRPGGRGGPRTEACTPRRPPNTHIFVFTCETWAVELVHGHDDSHDIFAVHDGCGQNVLCHVVRQLISKGAEVGTLGSKEERKERPSVCRPGALSPHTHTSILRQPPPDAQGLATGGAPSSHSPALWPRGMPGAVGPGTQQQGVRASVVPARPHPVPPLETAAQSSLGALFPLHSIPSCPCPMEPRLIRDTRMAQRWPPNHVQTSERKACWTIIKEGSSPQGE